MIRSQVSHFSERTSLFGLFGYPVSHSLSAIMQNHIIKKTGFNAVYNLFEINPVNLRKATESLKILGISGVNITIPFKENVIPYLDEVSEDARLTGSVNTVFNESGRLKGFNTDLTGFEKALESGNLNIQGINTIVIGAGGAGRTAAYSLLKNGAAKVVVLDTVFQKARKTAEDYAKIFSGNRIEIAFPDELDAIESSDLVVNASPAGMTGRKEKLRLETNLRPLKNGLFFDLVYNPPKTPFLKFAEKKGVNFMNGLKMLIFQGIESFKIWTGISMDETVLFRELEGLLMHTLKAEKV